MDLERFPILSPCEYLIPFVARAPAEVQTVPCSLAPLLSQAPLMVGWARGAVHRLTSSDLLSCQVMCTSFLTYVFISFEIAFREGFTSLGSWQVYVAVMLV